MKPDELRARVRRRIIEVRTPATPNTIFRVRHGLGRKPREVALLVSANAVNVTQAKSPDRDYLYLMADEGNKDIRIAVF